MSKYQINPSIFKAYDIRGVYPSQVNEDVAYAIGRAFATYIQSETVLVGRDMRLSGEELAGALMRGLTDQGVDVIDVGMVSTDQYYFACAQLKHPGIMVTASHNPPEYNGFKMVRQMPYLLSGDEGIQDLRKIIESDGFAPLADKKGSITKVDLSEDFIGHMLSLIDVNAISGLKVLADTGNGMVGPILGRIFERIPNLQYEIMYSDPDGSVPNHGLDPLQPENRAELEQRVASEGFDIGFAYDGDGDRFFAIDDRGKFVPGDYMTALLAEYILGKYPNSKVLYDVRASWAAPNLIEKAGGTPLIERVGHAFIKKRMAEEDAVFAGEVSGHYYFKDFFFADSGVLPSLLLLEMIAKQNRKLSERLIELESQYFISGEINSSIQADAKQKMQELADMHKDGKVEWLDGVSVTYDDWHFNVRASNTEPLLRLNLEATTRELMEQKRDELLAIIRR